MEPEKEASEVLKNGGVIVHATEAVYGLAASMYDYRAFDKICVLKERPSNKKFIVLFADINAASKAVELEVPRKSEIMLGWPGPNTWVLPAKADVPFWLKDTAGCLAVRVTAHRQCSELIKEAGPVLSTSANRAGGTAPKTLCEAERNLGDLVDFYLPGTLGGLKSATTIKNGSTGEILRK